MAEKKYYVICADDCLYEGMTKEQTIAAIAEATGNTPTRVDEAFITKIQELNKNKNLSFWYGTEAEFNALGVTAEKMYIKVGTDNKVYICPDTGELYIPDDAVGTRNIESKAVTREKLADDVKALIFTNKSVATTAWSDDTTYSDFPKRAKIPCSGVTTNFYPEVVFSPNDAMSGEFCQVASTYAGGVYIYAASVPSGTVTIPTIICTPVQ